MFSEILYPQTHKDARLVRRMAQKRRLKVKEEGDGIRLEGPPPKVQEVKRAVEGRWH